MNDEFRAKWGHLFADMSDADIDALRHGDAAKDEDDALDMAIHNAMEAGLKRRPIKMRWPSGDAAVEQLGSAWHDERLQRWTGQWGTMPAEFSVERQRLEMIDTAAAVLARLAQRVGE